MACNLICHLTGWEKKNHVATSVGICGNYVENKLEYASKFQQLTKLITKPFKCTEQQ